MLGILRFFVNDLGTVNTRYTTEGIYMRALSFLVRCLICAPMAAMATTPPSNDYMAVDRYAAVSLEPTAEQQDILSAIVNIEFDASIKTVGMAVNAMLRDSGYTLADPTASDPMMRTLLASTLPRVHQQLGPMHLEAALRTLAGPGWVLVVDRIHRRVSFEVIAAYTAPCDPSTGEDCQ